MLEGDFQFRKHARVKLKTPTKDGQTEIDSYQLLRTISSAQREVQIDKAERALSDSLVVDPKNFLE